MPRSLHGCAFLLALCCADVFAAARSLGIHPPEEQSVADGINARGQAAAMVEDEGGRQRGFFFEKGHLLEIRTYDRVFHTAPTCPTTA